MHIKSIGDECRETMKTALSLIVAISLVFGLLPNTPAFADNGSDVSVDSSDTTMSNSSKSENQNDISAAWKSGDYLISEGGDYYVTEDFTTTGTLFVAAPEGETVSIDFKGHSVSVYGSSAAVDVSNSAGSVVIKGGVSGSGDKSAALSFTGKGLNAAACAILANYASIEGAVSSPSLSLSDLKVSSRAVSASNSSKETAYDSYALYVSYADKGDNRKSANVSLTDVAIESSITNAATVENDDEKVIPESESGIAYGLYSSFDGIQLDGKFSSDTHSSNLTCDLYSTQANAFVFGDTFGVSEDIRVYAGGNVSGEPFAQASSNVPFEAELLAHFIDASGKGLAACQEETAILFSEESLSSSDENGDSGNSVKAPDAIQEEQSSVLPNEDNSNAALADTSSPSTVTGWLVESGAVDTSSTAGKANNLLRSALSLNSVRSSLNLAAVQDESDSICLNNLSNDELNLLLDDGFVDGKTYYLSDDLTISDSLTLSSNTSKANKSITLALNGHTLTVDSGVTELQDRIVQNSFLIGLNANTEKRSYQGSLTINGLDSGGNRGKIIFKNNMGMICLNNGLLNISNVDVSRVYESQFEKISNKFSEYPESGVIKVNGTKKWSKLEVNVENSSFTNDLNNVKANHSSKNTGKIYAAYLSGNANGISNSNLSFKNVDFKCIASDFALFNNQYGTSAYGVAVGNVKASFENCTYFAQAKLGNAYCLDSFYLKTEVSVKDTAMTTTAGSGCIAAGIYKELASTLSVDGSLSYKDNSSDFSLSPASSVALHSAVEASTTDAPFKLGSGFSGKALPVLVGSSDVNSCNTDGALIASYEGEISGIGDAFVNGTGNEAVYVDCSEQGKVKLALDQEKAVVDIKSKDSVVGSYASLAEALKHINSGQTLSLRKAIANIELTPSAEEATASDTATLSYTLDLNGYDASSVSSSSAANWKVVSSLEDENARPSLKGTLVDPKTGSGYYNAVHQTGAGSLVLVGFDISLSGHSNEVKAAYAEKGSIVLDNCSISVKARNAAAAAVDARNANVVLKNASSVSVSQLGDYDAIGVRALFGDVTVSDLSTVSVAGVSTVYGVYSGYNSNKAVLENLSSVSVKLLNGAEDVNAYAVYEIGGTASIANSSVSATSEGDVSSQTQLWCLYNGDSVSDGKLVPTAATFQLNGSCTFVSGTKTHIRHSVSPISIDPSFSLNTLGDTNLVVKSENLAADNVFAQCTNEEETASLQSQVSMFTAMEGSLYEGTDVKVTDEGNLAWDLGCAVVGTSQDGSTITQYSTLAAAFSGAAEGDTLVVQDTEGKGLDSSSVAVPHAVTLDLNGQDVRINGGDSSAMSVTAPTGEFVVKNSGNSGSLYLYGNGGIDVKGSVAEGAETKSSCNVTIDGCSVFAEFYGVRVTGVEGTNAAVSLKGANLTVASSKENFNGDLVDDSTAGSVAAISVGSAAGVQATQPSVSVDSDSSISVYSGSGYTKDNDALVKGLLSDLGSSDSTRTVVKLDLSNQDLLNAITKEFRTAAQFDGAKTSKLGTNVYYSTALGVDSDGDGTKDMVVIAVSKKMAEDEVGVLSNIVPAVAYAYTSYDIAPSAAGVNAVGSASVDVRGSVTVKSKNGNAYSLKSGSNSTSSWKVIGAVLNAESQGASYEGDSGVCPDASAEVGEGFDLEALLKATNSSLEVTEVADLYPEAGCIAAGSSASAISLAGTNTFGSQTSEADSEAFDIAADSVCIEGDFALATDGDNPLMMKTSTGYAQEGAAFATAGEGLTLSGKQSVLFSDIQGKFASSVDAAHNQLVWSGSTYTVRFVDQYGNEIKSEQDVSNGQTVVLPPADSMAKDPSYTYSYEFLGWSTKVNATEDELDATADDDVLVFQTDGASATVTYYPIYRQVSDKVTVTFKRGCDENGNYLASQTYTVDTGTTLGASLESGPVASDFDDGSTTYKFVGWKNSSNDVFDGDWESLKNQVFKDNASFSAVYAEVEEGQCLVTFKVDGRIAYQVVNKGETPVYPGTSRDQGGKTPMLVSGIDPSCSSNYTYSFTGWRTGRSSSIVADSVDFAPGVALPSASEDAVYTATFTQSQKNTSLQLDFIDRESLEKGEPSSSPKEVTIKSGSDATFADAIKGAGLELVTAYDKDNKHYEFIGWSVRESDKEALFKNDEGIPASSSSMHTSHYYAIYKETDKTVNVTFKVGDSEFKAEGVKLSSTLGELESTDAAKQAIEAAKAATPEGKVFSGYWALESKPAEELNNDQAIISDIFTADASLVPVYVDEVIETVKVTRHFEDGVTADSVATVEKGKKLDLAGYKNPYRAGYSFAGWNTVQDGSGDAVDINDLAPEADIDLYAQWRAIATDVPSAVTADASAINVNDEAAINSEVTLKLVEADAANQNVSAKAALATNQPSKAYTVSLSFTSDDLTTNITKGFGTAKLTFPLDSSWKGHGVTAYYLDSNGAVQSATLLKEADSADATEVTLSLTNYTAADGNILLVRNLTDLENAQVQCIDQLEQALKSYQANEGDYTDFDGTVGKAYEDAIAAVKAATSQDDAVKAANEGLAAMKAVPTKSALKSAQAGALEHLAEAYAGYSKSNYTEENWKLLTAAYEAAKAAIQASSTADAASSAASAGIKAMGAIEVAGSTGGNASNSTNGGNGTSSGSGVKSTSGSGLSSTSDSGLSGTSGSGLSSTSGSGLSSTSGSNGLGASSLSGNIASAIGATLSAVDDSMAQEKNLSVSSGLYVESVEDGGLAQGAGIEAGDVITAVDGTPVSSLEDLQSILEGKSAGDSVTFTVNRNGEELTLTGTLTEDVGDLSATLDSGLGSSLESNADSGNSFIDWVKANLVIALILLFLLLGLIGLLIWWLLRRRNSSIYASDAPEDEVEGASSNTSGGIGF